MTAALCAPARCREVDPEIWFADWGTTPGAPSRPRSAATKAAKKICNRCEVREGCLEVAMSYPDEDQWGVWGGIDAAGRVALRASDPGRWPVSSPNLADFLGTREDRFGAERFTPGARTDAPWGECDGMERPPVDWAADALESNVRSLMERYETEPEEPEILRGELRYPTEIETGYALTGAGGTVYHVNDIKSAA